MTNKKKDILPKALTGIAGLDEVTNGGFPKGRPTLICGGAGCGKTLFALQFLVKGITEHNEPGVFMSFEETAKDLAINVKSLGFDLKELEAQNKLRMDYVRIERSEIEETGEYDLEALFVRLNHAINSVGAKRVVLDTIESLFSGLENQGVLRSEIRRLFLWLKEKGVTTIITAERGEKSLTRQGLEEYVSDCVILLDIRVIDQIATRRLRIIKYRGSLHGTNEYPFVIDDNGISVIPVTSLKLDYKSPTQIVSTGLPALDKLFSKGGIYKGSSTLITGTAGTAKTILASHFALSSYSRKEPVLFFSFEESPDQLIRNMGAVRIGFAQMMKLKLLHIYASRPTLLGLEMHLVELNKLLNDIQPGTVIIDPISSLTSIGSNNEVRGMLVRLIDSLKIKRINSVFTSLTRRGSDEFRNDTINSISSLADTWIDLCNKEIDHAGVRSLSIIKTRGMGHSNSKQDFVITNNGIQFLQSIEK
jgi:circadian clock protein KaiC